ncbi:MAG: DUF4129 domain-containing protein [Acidobacteriaceae bacterium]|nr:DUF4129 domain-containing protein [Acidobacteriaceae bacterium]
MYNLGIGAGTSAALFWIIISAAVGFLGYLLVRLRLIEESASVLKEAPPTQAGKTQTEWLRSARAAEAEGDWRRAIHSAYWAGIAYLEEAGALPRDHSATPREFLCLLLAAPDRAEHCAEPARALTRSLERFWYGRAAAAPDDFAACLKLLEALGCRVQ